MRCELPFFWILLRGELESYSRVHKQNTKPESKMQKMISITQYYKDFQIHNKFLPSSAYSRVWPNRKEDSSQIK